MGFDLKVLATHFRERNGEFLTTASLRLDRDARLQAQLSAAARPLPEGLKVGHYVDDGLRFETTDGYGKPLTFTTPADLGALRLSPDTCQWNRAVVAFLLALPPESRIVLYWC
jgi:hypothetical protein